MRVLIALMMMMTPAAAHVWVKPDGTVIDANWIRNHPQHSWCCGDNDCEPVPGRVRLTQYGWRVQGLKGTVPINRTYKSQDGQPWACRNLENNQIRCLFLPAGGN